jgi:hypothetical protein
MKEQTYRPDTQNRIILLLAKYLKGNVSYENLP